MRLRPCSLPAASCGATRLKVRDLMQPQYTAADEVVTVASEATKRRLDLSRCAAFRIGTIHSVHRRSRRVESMTQQQRVRGLVQMGGERRGGRPPLRLIGVVVSTCMHELSEGDDILAGDGGRDFRLAPLCLAPLCLAPLCLAPLCLAPRCLQVLRTHAHAHGARSARDVAIMAVLGPGALLIAAECD